MITYTRRDVLSGLALAAVSPSISVAQDAPIKTIAIVVPFLSDVTTSFRDYIASCGYRCEFTYHVVPNPANIASVRESLINQNPDLIFCWSSPILLGLAGPADVTASSATAFDIRHIPIVYSLVVDPIGLGVISRPISGRNVTGTTHVPPAELVLNTVQQIIPYTRVGFYHNPPEYGAVRYNQRCQLACRQLGLTYYEERIETTVAKQPDITSVGIATERLLEHGADWILIGPDTFLANTAINQITSIATRRKIPCFCVTETPAKQSACIGGLHAGLQMLGQSAAIKAVKILWERTPADTILNDELHRYLLQINLDVCKHMDIWPAVSLYQYANFRWITPVTVTR